MTESFIEEDEIKIEYYDTMETDPLCEEYRENTYGSRKGLDEIVLPSANGKQYEDCSNKDDTAQYNTNDHPISPMYDTEPEDLRDNTNAEVSDQMNWYREIYENGKFVCKFCELTYSTIQTIRYHVKRKHPEEANTLKNIVNPKKRHPKLKCHICKKIFKDIKCIKAHLKEHHAEIFAKSCQVCFAAFNNEQEMAEHIYQEHQKTNIRTYVCSICGYQTPKLSHLKQHRNTHLLTKKIKCDFCDYATNYQPNLTIHQRIHTNYKPYFCVFSNCGYQCSAKSALKSHQLKHYPEKNMLYCDKCTYKTVYRSSLKKHIDSHRRNSLKLL